MPLSRTLLAWVRSLFAGRPGTVQIALAVVMVLVGWIFLAFAFLVALIADGIALTARGRTLSPLARVGMAVGILLLVGAVTPRGPQRDEPVSVIATPSPSVTAILPSPAAVAPTATPSPSATPAPSMTTAPTATPAGTATAPAGTPAPTTVAVKDPRGDMLDENNEPVDGVAYQDIIAVSAEWTRDFTLRLTTEVAARPPKVDPVVEAITFAWMIDTNVDGSPEWLLVVENLDEPDEENAPGWGAGLTRMSDGQTLAGPEFPGTLLVDGTRIVVTTDLYARGDRAQITATAEHTVWTGALEATTHHDDVPQDSWPEGDDWLVIATP